MQSIIRLSSATHSAFACGVAIQVVTCILVTQHRGKLGRLFTTFAERFLEAFAECRKHPGSRQAAKRMQRAKATLDLIRARQLTLGKDKPNDKQILKWAQDADHSRIVQLRIAA